jgi:hypothetical protein
MIARDTLYHTVNVGAKSMKNEQSIPCLSGLHKTAERHGRV